MTYSFLVYVLGDRSKYVSTLIVNLLALMIAKNIVRLLSMF